MNKIKILALAAIVSLSFTSTKAQVISENDKSQFFSFESDPELKNEIGLSTVFSSGSNFTTLSYKRHLTPNRSLKFSAGSNFGASSDYYNLKAGVEFRKPLGKSVQIYASPMLNYRYQNYPSYIYITPGDPSIIDNTFQQLGLNMAGGLDLFINKRLSINLETSFDFMFNLGGANPTFDFQRNRLSNLSLNFHF